MNPNSDQDGVLPSSNLLPACPYCGNQMIRRTAGHGANQGNTFWGCPNFPKCHGKIFDAPKNSPTNMVNNYSALPKIQEHFIPAGKKKRSWQEKLVSVIDGITAGMDSVYRRYLESNEPDARGHWNKDHRRSVLKYVHNRDGGRCGLCAGDMKNTKGAQIEHIVPKVFAVFDIQGQNKATEGTQYKSLLHKLDNLQAAHTYCNKRKGNKPDIDKWRHPSMPPLGVAVFSDGKKLALPQTKPQS